MAAAPETRSELTNVERLVLKAMSENGVVGVRLPFISKELPVHLSNVAIADPKDGKPTRIGFKFVGSGDDRKKVRIAKRSGVEIDG